MQRLWVYLLLAPLFACSLARAGSGSFFDYISLDKRKPTLVYFWASWCKSCRPSMQWLDRLDAQNINLVGVNMDEDPDAGRAFAKRFNIRFKQIYQSDLPQHYQIQVAPTLLVFDNQQQSIYQFVGLTDARKQQIEQFIAASPVTLP